MNPITMLKGARMLRVVAKDTEGITRSVRRGIRRSPFRNVGAAAAVGVMAGVAVMLMLRARN